jgi:hydrogenase maturation protein HypF
VQRRSVRITGVVQGVGMRPFVHRLATELGLCGTVGNDQAGVVCEVEGDAEAIDTFVRRLTCDAPALAVVESVTTASLPLSGVAGFRIAASTEDGTSVGSVALVPADTATCHECLHEMRDPADRRYRYPFVACTFCGPRFTIVTGVPYDRPFTTMARFTLCRRCRREYDDPGDRRFHAQPTACPECGPTLSWRDAEREAPSVTGDAALAAAVRALREGRIVAVKGIGGYHLACDARRPEAVGRLRARKRRSDKPFALLAADMSVVAGLVVVDEAIEQTLRGGAAPIVLAPARLDRPEVVAIRDAVAPRQSTLGLMLPPSGLHHLLLGAHPDEPGVALDLLVLTSANLADEPICSENDEAEQRLAGVADAWLHHDRPIHLACDDSVVRVVGPAPRAQMQPVRRSRGYAPLPVRLPVDAPPLLAVGAEMKATVCLAQGRRAWLSQHLGDVASLPALALLRRTVDVLSAQSRVHPQVVVADMHPGYLSRRWATEHAQSIGARLVSVQHHHAHLAALLAEHERPPDEAVLGVTFDGTGYGDDASIWGGEFLLGSYSGAARVAHLRPVSLPGGDAAVRHPARVALAHLDAAGVAWHDELPSVQALDSGERRLLASMLRAGTGCVPTTSMGRLFDAVASLVGVCQQSGYEGQAAIELEAALVAGGAAGADAPSYRFDLVEKDGVVLVDPAPGLSSAVRDVLDGVPSAEASRRFHTGAALMVRDVARTVRDSHGVAAVGLTGGVFQNATMTMDCRRLLEADGFEVLVHRRVPPNDGGLALGQAMVAALGGGR